MRPTIWAFDVDGCLVDSLTGTSLRPHTADLLARLRASGAVIVVWSAGGAEYAANRLVEQGADHLVDRFHAKGARGADGRYLWPDGSPLDAVVFVDDRPEDLPVGANIVAVSPYLSPNPHDRALAGVLQRVDEAVDAATEGLG